MSDSEPCGFYHPCDTGWTREWDLLCDQRAKELGVYVPPEPGRCVRCLRVVEDLRTHAPRCYMITPYWGMGSKAEREARKVGHGST